MSDLFPFKRSTDKHRIAMAIEYKGTAYSGWQIQKSGVLTIQHEIEKAISVVANEPVHTIVAGRTDTGVHATNQIIHFDTQSKRDDYGWMMGVNGQLSADISIRWAKHVDQSFHARFSARERAYRFVIHNNWVQSALFNETTTWERYELDVEKMQAAANLLIGTHDFSSFRASECQASSPIRTLRELRVRRFGEFVILQARADGFLHHMVRNLVGVLLSIGQGRKPVEWAKQVLMYQDRTKGGVTAHGNGLYFVRCQYPNTDLPELPAGPAFVQPILDSLITDFDKV